MISTSTAPPLGSGTDTNPRARRAVVWTATVPPAHRLQAGDAHVPYSGTVRVWTGTAWTSAAAPQQRQP